MSIGQIKEFKIQDKNWDTYVSRLNNFFIANSVSAEVKVPTLLTVVGDETYELIVNLVNPEKPEDKSYEELVKIVKEHVNPEPNFMVGRFKFRKRLQEEGETVSEFAAALKNLAKYCDFKSSLNENLRDQLVFGLKSENVKQKLFAIKQLSYNKAYETAINMETAERDAHQTTSKEPTTLNRIQKSASTAVSKKAGKYRKNPAPDGREPCKCCGRPNHDTSSCFYKNCICNVCGKKGHLRYVCKKKITNKDKNNKVKNKYYINNSTNNETESDSENSCYNINREKINSPITVDLKLANKNIKMELDTGSSISVIAKRLHKKYFPNFKINKSELSFRYYTGECMQPLGYISIPVEYGTRKEELNLYIVENGGPPLIGRDWIFKLKILPTKNFNIESEINPVLVSQLIKEYPSVFTDKLGKFNKFKAKFHLKDNAKPIYLRARPLPYALKNKVEQKLDQLVKEDILIPVDFSNYATPIVPIIKKDGNIRICGDFKVTVNPYVQIDRFPIPKIDDLFTKLNGGKYFSKIDLSQAYNQIELDDESSKLVTINTHKGLFQYKRLPFGINSAPGIFQKIMEQTFGNIPGCCVFLDDILVTGRDLETHKRNLNSVLKKLKECGFTVKREKCSFFQKSVSYLGYKIDEFGLHPNRERIEAIINIKPPENITEIKAFLGLIGYYAKFINDMSTILKPIYKLLQKNVPFNWSKECQDAFNKIKGKLKNADYLAHYDPTLPITLACDASSYGIGAVISHTYLNGENRPIAYASRTLRKGEINYSQIQKEALAIIFGVKKFHQYLYGNPFTLLTDHKPLITIFGNNKGIPQMAASRFQRWSLILSGYNYKIKYIKSKDNIDADSLSRLPLDTNTLNRKDYGYINYIQNNLPLTFKKIAVETRHDIILSKIYSYIINGWPNKFDPNTELKTFYDKRDELHVEHGCILWGYRVLIPKKFKKFVLNEIHLSHMGINKCKSLARSYVWWPNIDKDIESECKNCQACQSEQESPEKSKLHPWEWPRTPWSRLHIDFLGPINNKKYFVIKDSHTKWIEVLKMNKTNALSVIIKLRKLFSQLGNPKQIVSDNGPPFSSKEMKDFCSSLGIKQTFAPPFHARSNGAAENAVKLVKKCIKKAISERKNIAILKYVFTKL